ncbi:MAG: O-antigen ligase family protein [Desulfobacterales bacterium]|nr:O-antigen ligase family protein [Desulfobacterales bacterium]
MIKKVKFAWHSSDHLEKLLWIYIVSIPFQWSPTILHIQKRIQWSELIFPVIFAAYLINYFLGKRDFKKNPLQLSCLIMILSFIPSILNSVAVRSSLTELAGFIYLILLLSFIINILTKPEQLKRALYVWIFTALFICLIGMVAFGLSLIGAIDKSNVMLYYGTIESQAHHFPRVQSTLISPNMFTTYIHTSLIFLMILIIGGIGKEDRSSKIILVAISVIFIGTAFLTGSRRITGILLSLFLILIKFELSKTLSIIKYVAFCGFIIFFLASLITSIFVIFPVKVDFNKLTREVQVNLSYSYSLHFLQPVTSLNMFKKHPLIGVGIGTYNQNFKDNVEWEKVKSTYGFEAYPEYADSVDKKTLSFDPHSVYLGALAETGITGLIGVLIFFSNIIYLLTKKISRASAKVNQNVLWCVLAGIIGFFLNGFTIDLLTMRHFWFLIGIGLTPLILHETKFSTPPSYLNA